MSKTKTRWTLEEARAAALKQFPCELNRYEIGRECANDNDTFLGQLLTDLLLGRKETYSKDAKSVVKVTVKTVKAAFQADMEERWTDYCIRQWCDANRIQRYQVDSAVWFESYGKDI